MKQFAGKLWGLVLWMKRYVLLTDENRFTIYSYFVKKEICVFTLRVSNSVLTWERFDVLLAELSKFSHLRRDTAASKICRIVLRPNMEPMTISNLLLNSTNHICPKSSTNCRSFSQSSYQNNISCQLEYQNRSKWPLAVLTLVQHHIIANIVMKPI